MATNVTNIATYYIISKREPVFNISLPLNHADGFSKRSCNIVWNSIDDFEDDNRLSLSKMISKQL